MTTCNSNNRILFIDTGVTDYESLIAGVADDVEVVLLDARNSALVQIASALAGRRDVETVHIVSHGAAGMLGFSGGMVDINSLDEYADDLVTIRAAMSANADLLLYGCNVAAGSIGQDFIQALADATGADVAASNDVTGSMKQGANWNLEVNTGEIEASAAFGVAAQNCYGHLLTYILNQTRSGYGSSSQFYKIGYGGNHLLIDFTTKGNFVMDVYSNGYWTGNTFGYGIHGVMDVWQNAWFKKEANIEIRVSGDATWQYTVTHTGIELGSAPSGTSGGTPVPVFSGFEIGYETEHERIYFVSGRGLVVHFDINGRLPIPSIKLCWLDANKNPIEFIDKALPYDIKEYYKYSNKTSYELVIPTKWFNDPTLVLPKDTSGISVILDYENTVKEKNEGDNVATEFLSTGRAGGDINYVSGKLTPHSELILRQMFISTTLSWHVTEFEIDPVSIVEKMCDNLFYIINYPGSNKYSSLAEAIFNERNSNNVYGQNVIDAFVAETENKSFSEIWWDRASIQSKMLEIVKRYGPLISNNLIPFNNPSTIQVLDIELNTIGEIKNPEARWGWEPVKITDAMINEFIILCRALQAKGIINNFTINNDQTLHLEIPQPLPPNLAPNAITYATNKTDTFNLAPGSYKSTIVGFDSGDKILLPTGHNVTLENLSLVDGKVDLRITPTGLSPASVNGGEIILSLSLTAAQDQALLSLTSFDSVFGKGSVVIDDFNNTILTTGQIAINGAGTMGQLESEGDQDWFAVTLEAGQTYAFRAKGGANSMPVNIYDSAGNLSLLDTGYFTAPATGIYYLNVFDYKHQAGSYIVTANQLYGFITGDSAPDNFLLNTSGKLYFDTSARSDIKINLTGLDQNMKVGIWDIDGENLVFTGTSHHWEKGPELLSWKPSNTDASTLTAKNIPAGRYYFEVTTLPGIKGYPFIGAKSDSGFNIDYVVTKVNHAPVFQGVSNLVFIENKASEYSYGNAFLDQDSADGDALNFVITQTNGNPLPTWIQLDTASKTIKATPPTGSGDVNLHIVATDLSGATATADLVITTPSPVDKAGNTLVTARALGALVMNNAQNLYLDYVGVSDDTYDYYSFSASGISDINIMLSNITGGADLDTALLLNDGSVFKLSTFDTNTQQEKLNVTNLAADNYFVRVNANSGHGDYQLSVQSSAVDGGGNALAPAIVHFNGVVDNPPFGKFVDHFYIFSDYVSSGDTLDSYQFNFDTRAYVGVYNLDSMDGRGFSGVFSGNGLNWDSSTVNYRDVGGGFDGNGIYQPRMAYFADGLVSAGSYSLNLSPDTWLSGTRTFWVKTGPFPGQGHYETINEYTTYGGFTTTAMVIDRLPTVANPVVDQMVTVSQQFSFVVTNAFQDVDGDAIQTITATLVDGSALPSWLVFDPSTFTFSGELQRLIQPVSVSLTAVFAGAAPISFRTVNDTFIITPMVTDNGGSSSVDAQTLIIDKDMVTTTINSTDGNDYFSLQTDHAGAVAIIINQLSPGAQAILMLPDQTVLQTYTADSNGHIGTPTPVLAAGTYLLHITAAANANGYSLSVGDYLQPMPFSQPDLSSSSDFGVSDADDITNTNMPVLTGTAGAGVTVRLFDGSDLLGDTVADDLGLWTFATPVLEEGVHSFAGKTVDTVGNESTASGLLNVTIDTISPEQPIIPDLLAITDPVTYASIPVLTGTVEAEAIVSIFADALLLGSVVANSVGRWSFTMPNLEDGLHAIVVTATDKAGNQSNVSDPLYLTAIDWESYQVSNSDNQILIGTRNFNMVSFENTSVPVSLALALTTSQNIGFGNITIVGIEGLIGSAFNDVLKGNEASNILDGGAGADSMVGGLGDDSYIIDNSGDSVNESASQGSDTVTAFIDYSLGSNVENLTLKGTAAINGTGNALNNLLIGNDAANVLNGGAGADTMEGGDGNDIYYVNIGFDKVFETNLILATGGMDTVYATINYTLGSNIENLRIFSAGNLNGTGNALDNVLYAGAGNNVLNGGTGVDTAAYSYAAAGVTVGLVSKTAQTTGGSGSDTLLSIENLIGSKYNDMLIGNNSNNVLAGGLGKDIFTGGLGADTFKFDAAQETGITISLRDIVKDFSAVQGDKLDLSGIDANTLVEENQSFTTYKQGNLYTGVFTNPGDLYFNQITQILYGNNDADKMADFSIQITGVVSLSVNDMVL